MATLEIKLVSDTSGNIDIDATLSLAETQLQNVKAQRETEDAVIASHADALFDELKVNGTRVNMPFVVSSILQRMNVQAMPGSYQTLHDKVHAYLSSNAQGKTLDKATKTVERPDSKFVIGKGKSKFGGIARRADIADAEALAAALEA